jgi:tetratricopeptide (TPR) repeat protein
MPGHIYTRVGRYHDAVIANQKAIESDNVYLSLCSAKGIYPFGYVPHNHHFLWFAASMEGASDVALKAARETGRRSDLPEAMRQRGFSALQNYWMTPLFAMVRFGRWDEIVAAPEPPADIPYTVAVWHYAQGLAAVRQGRLKDADAHHAALSRLATDPAIEALVVWDRYTLAGGLHIADRVLAAEIAAARHDYGAAVAGLQAAVDIEDGLPYDEPPAWHAPVRHTLGAVLLRAGRAAEAQAVYEADLQKNRDNGWALFGLTQALRAQGKSEQAAEVERRFTTAWRYADVKLAYSVF